MKKCILILAAFFTVTAISAQITWDVRIGANVSQFTKGGDMLKLGLKAGVAMEYSFSDLFSLRPAVNFSMKGSSVDGDFGIKKSDTYNLSYIEIPVYAMFRIPVSGNFSLSIGAGPYAGILLNKPDGLEKPKTFDAGVGAMLDFNFGRFSFGPEVTYGFTEVTKAQKANICYSLTFGYKF